MKFANGWRRGVVAWGMAGMLVAAGCSTGDGQDGDAKDAAATTRMFAADNGDVEIPVDPQRVVATGYAVPALIEADAALVGISSWKRGVPLMTDEDLQTYEDLEKIAGETALETNYEAIAAVEPDLIVIGVPKPVLSDIDLARLETIAPVVAIGPTIPSAWREQSRRQADAAGRLTDFDETKSAYDDKAAALKADFADALGELSFGHLGAYGDVTAGEFQREYAGSWGTNIAEDIGVRYPGEVREKTGGSGDVTEYLSLEEIPQAFEGVDAITYTVGADGAVAPAVQQVLDSELWKGLPAVQSGRVYPLRYTEAATYTSATKTLDAAADSLAPLKAAQ